MANNYSIKNVNYIKTTANLTIVNLSCDCNGESYVKDMILDIEQQDDAIDSKVDVNKYSFKCNGKVIHDMHDVKDTLYHHLSTRKHKYPYESQKDYQHIYKSITNNDNSCSATQSLNFVQAYNTLYVLTDKSKNGHYFVNDKIYNYLCRDNEYVLPRNVEIQTFIHNKDKLLSGDLNTSVSSVLSNACYNYVYEIPGNIQQKYSDGTIYATAFKTKNHLNAAYDMSHDDNYVLKNTRNYYEIGNCNNQVYLKYKDNEALSATNRISSLINNITYQNTQLCSIQASDGCGNIPQIEMIQNVNRGLNTAKHKSSLYSIDIQNRKLFSPDVWNKFNDVHADDSSLSVQIQNNIKLEIKTCLRKLIENVAPANTQLFAITVNE